MPEYASTNLKVTAVAASHLSAHPLHVCAPVRHVGASCRDGNPCSDLMRLASRARPTHPSFFGPAQCAAGLHAHRKFASSNIAAYCCALGADPLAMGFCCSHMGSCPPPRQFADGVGGHPTGVNPSGLAQRHTNELYELKSL
jgi:hypothetical protein